MKRKKQLTALALALCLSVPAYAAQASFSDVPAGAWYEEAVAYCRENGLLQGVGDGRFLPEASVTRAMLASVLHRMAGTPEIAGGETFADVSGGAWYASAIRWANAAGVMRGYGNGRFGPEDPVTREQLAAVLWRWAGCPAAQAAFSGPKGVAVAPDGAVYVADTDNGAVRRIRDGQVTTILSRDARDTSVLFPISPTGLLLQGSTLYISDPFARKLLAMPLV